VANHVDESGFAQCPLLVAAMGASPDAQDGRLHTGLSQRYDVGATSDFRLCCVGGEAKPSGQCGRTDGGRPSKEITT
jgi:hypothetical protein